LCRTATKLKWLAEGTAPPMEMTEEEAENVPAEDVTVAVIVAGPGTTPAFRMTETLPAESVVPEAVVGVASGGPM
jgi:hypothetical protein